MTSAVLNNRILIVDDDKRNRWALSSLLREEGYETLEAAGVGEMADVLRECRPGLILLDYVMPGGNGIKICHDLKRAGDLKSIPVVIVSVTDDRETMRRGLEAGAVAWLIKPIDMDLLLEHVRSAVR